MPAGSSPRRAHDLGGLADDFAAAAAAERAADARVQQPQVVVDLGRRADGRARIADAVLLADGDRRADAFDRVDVRLLHPLEELPRVGRQRLDVAALPFGVDRVEGERRLARAADAGHHDERAGGSVTSTFLRLCVRAPRTTICPRAVGWLAWTTCALSGEPEQSMVAQHRPASTSAPEPEFPGTVLFLLGTFRGRGAVPDRRAADPTRGGCVSPSVHREPALRGNGGRVAGAPVERRRTGPDRSSRRSGNRPAARLRVRRLCGSRASPKRRSAGSTSSRSRAGRSRSAKRARAKTRPRRPPARRLQRSAARRPRGSGFGASPRRVRAARGGRLDPAPAGRAARAAGTSVPTRRPRTSASRSARTATRPRVRSRSVRSATLRRGRGGAPRTRTRTLRSTTSRRAKRKRGEDVEDDDKER